MRYLLNAIHPDLERALDLSTTGPLIMLSRYVTAAEIRAAKPKAIVRFLRSRDARHPEKIAKRAHAAALAHLRLALPGEAAAADLVREMAEEAIHCRTRIAGIDRKLVELITIHPDGALIRSLPGIGVVLAAELLAQAGDLSRFRSAAALASAAGLAPVLRQSGKSARLQRPGHANSRLKRVFYHPPSARSASRSAAPTTTANAPRESDTTRPSSPSPDAVSTCSGPSSHRANPSTPNIELPLD